MSAFQTILHPTDFSEPAAYAFRLACSLARDQGARLIVLHVWSKAELIARETADLVVGHADPLRNYAMAVEERLRQTHTPDAAIRVEYRTADGSPAAEILRVAQETACDLIVMGTHGRTGLQRLLTGSVAEQVIRGAACPVLTVKTPLSQTAA